MSILDKFFCIKNNSTFESQHKQISKVNKNEMGFILFSIPEGNWKSAKRQSYSLN